MNASKAAFASVATAAPSFLPGRAPAALLDGAPASWLKAAFTTRALEKAHKSITNWGNRFMPHRRNLFLGASQKNGAPPPSGISAEDYSAKMGRHVAASICKIIEFKMA
jgi:hypothetical protein